MQHLLRRAYRGQMGAYLQFFVLLLLLAATILVVMAVSGCSDCDDYDEPQTFSGRTYVQTLPMGEQFYPLIIHSEMVAPGGQLQLLVEPDPLAGKRVVEWTPPPGATNFDFPGLKPTSGGPPFVFTGVDQNSDLWLNYTVPQAPVGTKLVDTIKTVYSDGSSSSTASETEIVIIAALNGPFPGPAAGRQPQVASPQADVTAWDVAVWFDSVGVTLTTELCQEWLTRLQGDDFFLAVRMPMTTTTVTSSYRLPFVFGSPYSQTLQLDDYGDPPGSPMLITAPLEYRPERHTFLANELPSAPGEHWAALGVSATKSLSCPAGLNVAPGLWGIVANSLLDLHDQPNACLGCTARVYYCYEGQSPPWEALAQRALARTRGIESYQGEGITCLGPAPVHLESSDTSLHMLGTAGAFVTPTLAISLSEHIVGPTYTVTVTMDYSSSVAGWEFYGGTWLTPNLQVPLTTATEIVVPAHKIAHIWAVNDYVPTDTVTGPHTLVITVTSTTSPSLTTWAAIPLWIGRWVAPPAGGGKQYAVYLPLIVKSP